MASKGGIGSWLETLAQRLSGRGRGEGSGFPAEWPMVLHIPSLAGGSGDLAKGFSLPESYLREIVAHAREGKPNEVCGLIAGQEGQPVKLYRTTNSDPNPMVRYNVEPTELLGILRELDERHWTLLAIYHSHPASEAYPSATDTDLAFYPEANYVIASLAQEEPVVRAFRIIDRQVHELELDVVQESR
ncbi:MAG TPA: M67 family metallopeptidase [Chloroflexota bacterium]|nr:M67 family metallopeptidase [Chloroflexota bacterium]